MKKKVRSRCECCSKEIERLKKLVKKKNAELKKETERRLDTYWSWRRDADW